MLSMLSTTSRVGCSVRAREISISALPRSPPQSTWLAQPSLHSCCPRRSSTDSTMFFSMPSTQIKAARRACWLRTIQRANSAASAVLPSPPWPRITA